MQFLFLMFALVASIHGSPIGTFDLPAEGIQALPIVIDEPQYEQAVQIPAQIIPEGPSTFPIILDEEETPVESKPLIQIILNVPSSLSDLVQIINPDKDVSDLTRPWIVDEPTGDLSDLIKPWIGESERPATDLIR